MQRKRARLWTLQAAADAAAIGALRKKHDTIQLSALQSK